MFSGFEEEDLPDSPLDRALYLQNILLSVAENGTLSQPAYTVLRRELMQSDARDILPEVVRTCRDHGSVGAT